MTTQAEKKLTRKDREFRPFVDFKLRAAQNGDGDQDELYVEGYAATFDDPTVLFEIDGVEYKEQIDDKAFQDTDMSDVIFNYNHSGKGMARTRNKTLQLSVDMTVIITRVPFERSKNFMMLARWIFPRMIQLPFLLEAFSRRRLRKRKRRWKGSRSGKS